MEGGTQIVGDFKGCKCVAKRLKDPNSVRNAIEKFIEDCTLTLEECKMHSFVGEEGQDQTGYTGMFILAESHVSVHTWPEKKSVNIDVYLCNHSRDNAKITEILYKKLVGLYMPTEENRQDLVRK